MSAFNPAKKNVKWRSMANPSRGRPRLSGSARQISLRSSVFLLWNARKASLGFSGASFSEFAKFLLHFPTRERDISAYEVSWVFFFYKTFPGLSNTITPFIPFEFFNSVKLHFSIWLVEFWRQMNLEMFLATWTRCWALHRHWVQSEVVQHQMLLQWDRQRETLWPLQSQYARS